MAAGNGRAIAAPILVLNFFLYVVVLGLAGWALNRAIDMGQSNVLGHTAHVTSFSVGNAATPVFIIFALIAGVVGVASIIAGAQHVGIWRTESLSGAASASVIAWLLTLLAFGLACKEIHIGGPRRNRRLKTLEAFVIILAGTQLIHILMLHTGVFGDEYGPRYRDRSGYGEHPKTAAAASTV